MTAAEQAQAARDARGVLLTPEAQAVLDARRALVTEERRDASWCGDPACPCADPWPICPEWIPVGQASGLALGKKRLCARCGNPLAVHPPAPEGAEPGWSLRDEEATS